MKTGVCEVVDVSGGQVGAPAARDGSDLRVETVDRTAHAAAG
ncbi:MAG: hypothetical protein ACR2HR_02180 [Euzebya sp.]